MNDHRANHLGIIVKKLIEQMSKKRNKYEK